MSAAVAEAAADAVVFERSLEEHALEAHPAFVPVGVAALGRLEAHCGRLLVAVAVEEAEMYGVYAHELAVADALRVDGAEPVAFLQGEEVHAPLIYVREVHDELRGCPGCNHVVPEGTAYGHVGEFAYVLHRLGDIPNRERVAAPEYGRVDLVLLIDRVAQHAGAVGGVVIGVEMVARLDPAQVEHRIAELAERVGVGSLHAHAHHEHREGVAVFDFHGVGVEFRGLEAVERRQFLDDFGFACRVTAVLAGKHGKRQRHGRQKHYCRIFQFHPRFRF